MPVKIFVGNLSSDTTGEDLRPLFESYGQVVECDVLRNFGFVHMSTDDEADTAINELTGTVVRGQRINVEKSTGGPHRGGGRGGGFRGSRGGDRGAPRGRGGDRGRGRGPPGRDYDPYPARPSPYARDPYPYDYYDRQYPERLPPRAIHPEDRRPLPPYDREERYPPPRDPYDRYPAARYPPSERYSPYERLPPRPAAPADPYDRPSPDYYRYRRPAPLEEREAALPPPPGVRAREAANGYDDPRRPDPAGGDSYSSSYSSYYDRFYSKPPANGAPAPPSRGAPGGARPSPAGRGGYPPAAKKDQQSMLQTGPIYF